MAWLRRAWLIEPAWPLSLGVAATAFSGHWDRVGVPFAVDRLLLLVGFVLAVGRAGSTPSLPPLRWRPLHLLLLAVLCYGVASAFWVGVLSDHDFRFGLIDRLGLVPFAAFVVAPTAFHTVHQRSILLRVLIVFGLYLGITALLEAAKAHGLVWPQYILDPTYGLHEGRARGPFVQAETNGLAMVACGAAAAIGLGLWQRRDVRVLCWAVIGLCFAGVVLTYTRAVWIGAGAGVIVALAVFPPLRWRLVPVAALSAAALMLGIALVPGLGTKLSDRFHESSPGWVRRTTNDAAVRMISERPVWGWGWGTYRAHSEDHFRTIVDIPYRGQGEDVHNVFLSRFVELGIVGGGLWLIANVLALGGAAFGVRPGDHEFWRRGFLAVLAATIASAMLSPLSSLFPILVLWLWAGVVGPRMAAQRAPVPASVPA